MAGVVALRTRAVVIAVVVAATGWSAACSGRILLTDQLEARRLGASLHVNFVKANEAATRAVMSAADDASMAAAREANDAADHAQQDLGKLEPLVQSLGYKDEIAMVRQFGERFAEYRQLDTEILPLAVENTNLKAQRLAFGRARELAEALSAALDRVVTRGTTSSQSEALTLRVRNGILEMQAVEPRHIAEPDDAAMTEMEGQMAWSESRAREALQALRRLGAGPADAMAAATDALDGFVAVNRDIVQLSRRNTNVRSLAATLGRKRVVAAECESELRALDNALAAHTFKATR